jgi:hypothetical protein
VAGPPPPPPPPQYARTCSRSGCSSAPPCSSPSLHTATRSQATSTDFVVPFLHAFLNAFFTCTRFFHIFLHFYVYLHAPSPLFQPAHGLSPACTRPRALRRKGAEKLLDSFPFARSTSSLPLSLCISGSPSLRLCFSVSLSTQCRSSLVPPPSQADAMNRHGCGCCPSGDTLAQSMSESIAGAPASTA